jgi:hypothetical protein
MADTKLPEALGALHDEQVYLYDETIKTLAQTVQMRNSIVAKFVSTQLELNRLIDQLHPSDSKDAAATRSAREAQLIFPEGERVNPAYLAALKDVGVCASAVAVAMNEAVKMAEETNMMNDAADLILGEVHAASAAAMEE